MAYTIDDLNALVQAASGDELPIWDVSATGNEEPTKKITLENLFSPAVNNNITLSGNWTSLQGGYYKLGKIVIVQLSAVYSGSFPANDYFTLTQSLPKPDTLTSFAVTTNTNDAKGAEAIMGIDRILKIKSGSTALTDQRVIVSGIYIAAS